MGTLEITTWKGDITTASTDAIVNAANSGLNCGAGVCGAIFEAAGALQLQAACDRLGRCPTGDAAITEGFRLTDGDARKWIIHAVGPVWRDGNSGEAEQLANAYRRAVEVADSVGAASVAFPAISTGIYGYDPEAATVIAVTTLRSLSPTTVQRVELVAFNDAQLDRNRRAIAAS
ncbi:MAG: macro domain-containing protein [Actinomycetes bacterium]